MARYRIGTVGYLNSEPLTSYLDPEKYEVVADHPRGIASRLARGDVMLALSPVAAVLSDGAFRIAPGWCIGADGPVASVLLVAETPPEAWEAVALDGESRTSVTLARILLQEGPLAARAGSVTFETVSPGEGISRARGTTAAVVIGDAARKIPDRLTTRIDLAECWKDWTGKPFVFAVWAGRAGVPQEVLDDIRTAGARGVQGVPSRYTGDDLVYLRDRIRYPLDEAALVGLRRYAALAKRAGLIDTEHVVLYGPPSRPRRAESGLTEALVQLAQGAPAEAAVVAQMMRALPPVELGVAAHLRRQVTGRVNAATYLHAGAVDASAATDQAMADVAETGAGTVLLRGLGALEIAGQVAALKASRAAGLQAVADDLEDLVRAARRDGVTWSVRLGVLRAAGLEAITWRLDGSVGPDVLATTNDAGCALRAVITWSADTTPETWTEQLSRVGTAELTSLCVEGWLPEGALVEPGSPSTHEWLVAVSAARLMSAPGAHIEAFPLGLGADVAQLALTVGADDFGWVGSVSAHVPDGAATFEVDVAEAERTVRVSGLDPMRRDVGFQTSAPALTRFRKIRRPEERAKL